MFWGVCVKFKEMHRLTKHLGGDKAKKPSKYRNRKVVKNGETWDSVREYERHLVLLDMQKRGEIERLERQVKFTLAINGVKICDYIADWTYRQRIDGRKYRVVDDAKGFQTPEFKLKWKLAQALNPSVSIWRLS